MSNKANVKAVWMYKQEGRFNLLSKDEQTQYVLRVGMEDGEQINISEVWAEPPYEEFDDVLPSHALCVIRDRIHSYLFTSHREEKLAKLDRLDAMSKYLDLVFLQGKKKQLETSLGILNESISELEEDIRYDEENVSAS